MKPDHIIEAHTSHINRVLFAQDGKSIFSMGFSGELRQWNSKDWSLIRDLEGHSKSVNCGVEHNAQLITGGLEGNINFYDLKSGSLLHSIMDHKKGVGALRVTPNGNYLLSSGPDRMVVTRDLDGSVNHELKPNAKNIGILGVTNDSKHVMVGGLGNKVQVFEIPSLAKVTEFAVGEVAITSIRINPVNGNAWCTDYKSNLNVLDLNKWEVLSSRKLGIKGVFSSAFIESRNELAVVCEKGVAVLDAGTLDEKYILESSAKGNYSVSISPDEKVVALGSADKRIRIWSIE